MSDDTPRQFASRRIGVLGGSRLFHQLTDDRDRVRPAPSLARLAWLERPDPDSVRGLLTSLTSPWPQSKRAVNNVTSISCYRDIVDDGETIAPD